MPRALESDSTYRSEVRCRYIYLRATGILKLVGITEGLVGGDGNGKGGGLVDGGRGGGRGGSILPVGYLS